MSWTAYPMLKTRMSSSENPEQREITIVPQNIVADKIDAYSSDVKNANGHRQLIFTMAGAKLDNSETGGFSGGFYWLSARQEQADAVHVASTVYFSGSGKNPSSMFMQQKHELEIIPQPFPHEHARYRANEDWKFLLRFNSKPLASQKVNLETQNGTKTELLSDAQGVVTVHIPDDFKAEAEQKNAGEHKHNNGRRSSDFVLETERTEGGKNYLTGFNSSYGPDAFDQRSLAMGLGFTLLGMIGATPLLRQRKASKKMTDAEPGTNAPMATETDNSEEA